MRCLIKKASSLLKLSRHSGKSIGSSGFTLIELITAATILSVLVAATARTYARYIRSSQEMDVRDVMSSLRKEVESGLSNPANLRRSLSHPENSTFLNCFSGFNKNRESDNKIFINESEAQDSADQANQKCDATEKDRFYAFVLLSSGGDVIAGGTDSPDGRRISDAARVMTARGETCSEKAISEGDERCEIEVTTAFRAVCPSKSVGGVPEASCTTPSTAELFFSIRQKSIGRFFKRGVRFPGFDNMVNSDGSARERFDALRVNVLEFMRPDIFECPDGQTFKGFDKNGKIQCGFQENPCSRLGANYSNWVFQGMENDGTIRCKKPLQDENCATKENPLRVLRGVLPDGTLDCVDPKASDQGCADGQVLVRFDKKGDPVCIDSALDKFCKLDQFHVGYDAAGKPKCVDVKTPGGRYFERKGPNCGHNFGNCRFTAADKPDQYTPKCPEGSTFVYMKYVPPKCCATCGWIGQWWCDYLIAVCSPNVNAQWQ